MPRPDQIINEVMLRISQDKDLGQLSNPALVRLRQLIGFAVAAENEACMTALWNASEGRERESMTERFSRIAELAYRDRDGKLLTSNTQTRYWTRWFPGLENDELTMGEVLDTLPGLEAEDVPAIVRAFENPDSPLKLPGACTLAQHDVLHILLGRGLVDQDEAFVIGFTAYCDPGYAEADIVRYKEAFRLYPEPYRIRGQDLRAFDLGIEAAKRMKPSDELVALEPEAMREQTLGNARVHFGIEKSVLYDIFEEERRLIPGTPWSLRLPRPIE